MKVSGYLIGAAIVSVAAAIADFDEECAPYATHGTGFPPPYFNSTEETALFIRCAETTYECDATIQGTIYGRKWLMINSSVEAIPPDCFKDLYTLYPNDNYTGPILMPGLTVLSSFGVTGTYAGTYQDPGPLIPINVTTIDLPDLVNISGGGLWIDNAASITSLNVPKLTSVTLSLFLNFTGGPPINLTFPRLFEVSDIEIYGEIDTLDFHSLNKTSTTIFINSTGDLDCNAFAKSVVNTTSYYREPSPYSYAGTGVSCTSKMTGTVNLTHLEPPIPEITSGAFKIQGGLLALTALLAYILAL